MYITYLELHQYKPFDFTGISTIKMDLTSPITVIMGTNGSGKSSLLREMTPLPASRPDYHKNGYKKVTIVHDNEVYHLETDFSNKISPHSFKREGVELNISGTTKVQEELVFKYFGYTEDIRKLTHMDINMCKMGPSDRKNYFINTNTVNLSFIIKKHMKALSKVRECKANLAHLYARKADIESKLLTTDNYETLLQRYDSVSKQSVDLDKVIYALEVHISQLEKSLLEVNNVYPSNVLDTVKSVISRTLNTLPSLSSVDRSSSSTRATVISTQLDQLHLALRELDTELNKVCTELNTVSIKIKESNSTEPKLLEEQILSLDKEISTLVVSPELVLLPSYDSDKVTLDRVCVDVREILEPLLYKSCEVWSVDRFTRVTHVMNRLKYELSTIESTYSKSQEEYTALVKSSEEVISPIPVSCSDDSCTVRTTLIRKLQAMNVDIERLKKHISITGLAVKKLQRKITLLADKLTIQHPLVHTVVKLQNIRNNTPILSRIIDSDKYTKLIYTSPLQIIKYIQDTITNTARYHLQQEKISQKQKLLVELDKVKLSSQLSVEYLQKQLQQLEDTRSTLLSSYANIERNISQLSTELSTVNTYNELHSLVCKYEGIMSDYLKYSMLKASIEYYTNIVHKCRQRKTEIATELADIQLTVKTQKSLRDRYEEEVVKHISTYENSLSAYTQIEAALSPKSGIPHKYTVKYINSLIKNVTYFTSKIFTYPLTINELDEHSSIDFSLPVSVDKVQVKDISKTSKGQSEVINFAWSQAILYHLKLLDKYPIILDEIGTGFDPIHTQRFIEFLYELIERKYVSQIFLVNHGTIVSSGFVNSNIICIKEDNVILPEVYNNNTTIVKY